MNNRKSSHVAILGGGLAGLFAAYHLKRASIPVTIYEARDRIGGNCVTFVSGDFRFDSGAHRFHDKDKAATVTMKHLLGDRLRRTEAPSRIYSGGRLVDFPLSALNLLKSLGPVDFAKSTYQIARSRFGGGREPVSDLEGYATRTYGSAIAERFLLNYSEKLWGVTPDKLSSGMAKVRLKGLSVQGFIREALLGSRSRTEHLDGAFYYPDGGIGAIGNALLEAVGEANIRRCSRVTKIAHDGNRLRSVVVNGSERVSVDQVISTIPLPGLLKIMDPPVGDTISARVRNLLYRNLLLVALFLDRDSVTKDAVIYFPEKDFVFTRAYEPKNRGPGMAPPGQTSLVLEIPCYFGDSLWCMGEEQLVELVLSHLSRTSWFRHDEITGTEVRRMEYAYPVVDVDTADLSDEIMGFLGDFSNLRVAGRNGRFVYCSIHDLLIESREIADEFTQPAPSDLQPTLETECGS